CYLSIPSPVEEDTSKIWDTTGTVFIQGPSIVLLVWRSIMFNGSFLRVCRILRLCPVFLTYLLPRGSKSRAIVPVDFASRVWADQAMVPGFGVSAECQSIGTIGKK